MHCTLSLVCTSACLLQHSAAIAASLELTFHNEGYATLMCSKEYVRAGHFDGSVSGCLLGLNTRCMTSYRLPCLPYTSAGSARCCPSSSLPQTYNFFHSTTHSTSTTGSMQSASIIHAGLQLFLTFLLCVTHSHAAPQQLAACGHVLLLHHSCPSFHHHLPRWPA